jgi:hypothetical protein
MSGYNQKIILVKISKNWSKAVEVTFSKLLPLGKNLVKI